jgi:hypothetical protein
MLLNPLFHVNMNMRVSHYVTAKLEDSILQAICIRCLSSGFICCVMLEVLTNIFGGTYCLHYQGRSKDGGSRFF